jgi:CHAD domain-containing protein
MGRLTELVRRAAPQRASAIARALALRVLDRAVSRIGDIADAVRPALGAAREAIERAEPIDVVPRAPDRVPPTRTPEPTHAAPAARQPDPPAPAPPITPATPSIVPATQSELAWTLARHLSTQTTEHLAALLDTTPWTDTGHDAELLRKLRVASRRLRALVALFTPWLRPKVARRLRRDLKKIGRALGPLREWDVVGDAMHGRLLATTDAAQAVALEHVLVDIARRRDAARARARRALDRLDRERLREDIDQTIAAAIAPFIQHRVDPKREAWTLLAPCIEAAFADAPVPTDVADHEAVHAVRIEAKRLRYAYDLLDPALDDGRARKTLKLVQRRIGDARDRKLLADFVDQHRRALERDDRPRLAAGLAPIVETLRNEADAASVHVAPALARFDHAHIVATTQAALGMRPLAVVPDEALA